MKRTLLLSVFVLVFNALLAQQNSVKVSITDEAGEVLPFVTVFLEGIEDFGGTTDGKGEAMFKNLPFGEYELRVSLVGYRTENLEISVEAKDLKVALMLEKNIFDFDEIVVTGTQGERRISESPLKIDILKAELFQKNPMPSLFQSLEMVNGVQSQMTCNVCNTGDIRINGMDGGYTMILIDGMPIVSGLSTVYGLMGIPNSIIERVEIVKGPASALFGSEAMAGVINVITKDPLAHAHRHIEVEAQGTTWGEFSFDGSLTARLGKKVGVLLSGNFFNFNQRIDRNGDNFTDLALQNRFSIFNKWSVKRPENRQFDVALRYVQEDRWGGEMQWSPAFRGTDVVYGESIWTRRAEGILNYELPSREPLFVQLSYNWHYQNSAYGNAPFNAVQQTAFGQFFWDKKWNKKWQTLTGTAFRYNFYDDDTPATGVAGADEKFYPSVFGQTEWQPSAKQHLLVGLRYDFNRNHGHILSPRVAYRLDFAKRHQIRLNAGTGFRTVYIFTEDHAALSGAREVVIGEELSPERSYNAVLNYVFKLPKTDFWQLDVSGFYNYFTNKIVGDFDSAPTQIIYENLDGNAVTRGVSLNLDYANGLPLKASLGVTYMDVLLRERNADGIVEERRQLYAPRWSGNYLVSYSLPQAGLSVDVTGRFSAAMRLPTLPNDFRPEFSPFFTILNIKISKKMKNGELYAGVRNLLNFVPQDPIMRPFDPFDRNVDDPIANPNGYFFDPTYNFALMQGIHGFGGVRWRF